MRYAVIDLASNLVSNVVEIVPGDGSTQPEGFLHVASAVADIGDSWNGTVIVPKPQSPHPPLE